MLTASLPATLRCIIFYFAVLFLVGEGRGGGGDNLRREMKQMMSYLSSKGLPDHIVQETVDFYSHKQAPPSNHPSPTSSQRRHNFLGSR